MVYRYTQEDLDAIKAKQAVNLANFQRNSGRGLPPETVSAMEHAQGVKMDENGAPIPAPLEAPVKHPTRRAPKKHKTRELAPVPLEEIEAKDLMQWARMQRWHGKPISDVLIHIPNGSFRGYDRKGAQITAGKLKEQGMQPGVYDYLVPVPIWTKRCPGLWVELKRTRGGVVSPDQKAFGLSMQALGWRCEVALGWEAASKIVLEYLRSVPG